jgi:hypothetical protein
VWVRTNGNGAIFSVLLWQLNGYWEIAIEDFDDLSPFRQWTIS